MMLMVVGMLMPMLINREWDAIADSKDAAGMLLGDADADSKDAVLMVEEVIRKRRIWVEQ